MFDNGFVQVAAATMGIFFKILNFILISTQSFIFQPE